MADLTDDRGQMILIAAFALAVTFVALALIVNSAIFTENLASRGETAGSDDALSMRAMIEQNAGDVLDSANRFNYSNLDVTIDRGIRNTSVQTEQQQVTNGVLVSVTWDESDPSKQTEGLRIANNSSSATSFDEPEAPGVLNSPTNYTVVRNVERISGVNGGNGTRAFVINASEIVGDDNASSFEIEVRDSSLASLGNTNTWQMHIWNSSGDRTIHVVTVKNNGGTVTRETCQVESRRSYVRIDVTDGTIDSQPCDALGITANGENMHFASGATDKYDIRFKNTSEIRGNFSMIVNADSGDMPGYIDNGPPVTDGLYYTEAYYSITVRYTYDTADLQYVTDIRVAPGEPDV